MDPLHPSLICPPPYLLAGAVFEREVVVDDQFLIVPVIVAALVAIILFLIGGQFLNLYIQALLSGARVSLLELIGMRLRKVDLRTVVYSRIRAVKAGLDVTTAQLEAHDLSGGRVSHVVSAMIAARNAGVVLPWSVACAADLSGHDPLAGIAAMLKGGETTDEGREAARVLLGLMREAGASTAGLRPPDGEPRSELEPLVGAVGEVVEALDPEGRVRIGARTYLAESGARIEPGTIVRITAAGDGRLRAEPAR